MNNKQNNVNRGLLDQSRGNIGGQYQNYITSQGNNLNQTRNADQNLRDEIFNRYSDPNSMSIPGLTPNSQGWFNLPGSSTGVAQAGADFSAPKAGYQDIANTGGIGTYQPALDSYKNFMATGGIEGGPIRAAANSVIPSFYKNYADQMKQRANVQGGYSPGFDAQAAEMGRQAGREGYNTSLQTESQIAQMEQQGKEFGTSGYAGAAGQITGNRLAGLGGLTNIGNAELGASEFNAGQANSRYNTNLGAQLSLADMYSRNRFGSAQGLQGLYSSAPGATGQSMQGLLAGLGGLSQEDLANLGERLGIKDRSWTDLIPGLVGSAGGIMTGIGGLQHPSGGAQGWT